MNNPRKDLSHYFDAFRETERMSETRAWEILEKADDPDPVVPPIQTVDNTRNRRMIFLTLALIAFIGGALLIDLPIEERSQAEKLESHQTTGIPEEKEVDEKRVEQRAPAGAQVVSPYMQRYRRPKAVAANTLPPAEPLPSTTLVTSDSARVDTIFKMPERRDDPPTPIIQGPVDMPGVRILDLTREELIAFGIVPDDKGAGMFMRTGKSRTFFNWIGYESWSMKVDTTPVTAWPAPILAQGPVLTTGRDGGLKSIFVDEAEFAPEEDARMRKAPFGSEEFEQAFAEYKRLQRHYLNSIAPTLIPILIRTGAGKDHPDAENMVLWFQPRSDIIANLPETIRDRVTEEVKGASDLARGVITHEQALRPNMTPTLDLIRSANGSIARSSLKMIDSSYEVQLSLRESRILRVELYDIEGRRLDQLLPARDLAFGEQTLRFDIPERAPGIYLVVVASDRQERAVFRVFLKSH